MSFATEAWTPVPKARTTPSTTRGPSTILRQEDDWTRVKDPKEKKRIQNRVAQRTYRHRMKARLGELQARLDSHEGKNSSAGANPTATSPHTTPSMAQSTSAKSNNNTHANSKNTADTSSYRASSSAPISQSYNGNPTPPGHGGAEESPSPIDLSSQSQVSQMSILQPGIYDHQPVMDTESAMFSSSAHFLNSPPHSRSSPQAHGLLSPPGHSGTDRNGHVPQDFMMDLHFQTPLLTRLHTIEPDNGFSGLAGQSDGAVANNMNQADQQSCVPTAFTPSTSEGMDLAFETAAPVDVWKTEPLDPSPLSHAICQDSSPAEMHFHALPSHVGPAIDPGHDMNSRSKAQQCSLEERFEPIMQQVEASGFESFDALVTAYYSENFGDASPLANEQRLSRNRRLPKVVSEVFQAASGWSSWEKTGFHEELLKSTEAMLMGEGSAARANLMSTMGPLVDAQDTMGTPRTAEALHSMKRTIQNEVPNSWALCMALATDQRASWQRDRSNTALATILLLNFSGRIPNDQLLRLIGACL
ncbi:hypothetical protein B0I35DRAFT_475824 [Stachybotrys elegans]|uniref:BZIP domain-containing protein n=1 Tax=Stachybotrys elegans TaxID=80388 RepID=A0A8K0WVL6_9HYPO|nr:hypothetical protein B0I35DRAFT_475824 [Stachybotrys elegans]